MRGTWGNVRGWDRLHTRRDVVVVFFIMLAGLVPRLYLLWATDSVIDSDEAIVGLMAKHILEGRPWPVFYYGQHYMGSLEAILTAGVFGLMGMSNWSLKVVPLFFSIVFIGCVYALARRFTDRLGASVAALLAALGPSALILWSTKARGGFIEMVVIGTYALILGADILRYRSLRASQYFLVGVVVGIGWWVNNQIIFYGAALACCLAILTFRRGGIGKTVELGLVGATGFLLGGWPFWYQNLTERPWFQSRELFGRASPREMLDHLGGYVTEALPIILGARRFWSNADVFPGASMMAFVLYGAALCVVTITWLNLPVSGFREAVRTKPGKRLLSGLLLALFVVGVPLIFSASRYGWLSQAPRYLLPLYSVIFVFVGVAASSLWAAGGLVPRVAGLLLAGGGLGLNLASMFANGGALPGQPFVFRDERVRPDHRELYHWLEAHDYRSIKTNYWIGYRVAFETEERITFSRFRGPQTIRIPEYEQQAPTGLEESVLVLVPQEAEYVTRGLSDLGYLFEADPVGGYVVVHHIRPIVHRGPVVPLYADSIHVSSRDDWKPALVDGDLGTRWGSGEPQHPDMEIEVSLPQPTELTGVDIDHGFWTSDYARALTIELVRPDGSSCAVLETRRNPSVEYVAGEQRFLSLTFPPVLTSAVRLIQRGEHPILDWSVAELTLFGSEPEATQEQ
ncbi:MAG: discoidin domain-containing protein [Bdellovibrionales bacterium]|nr:discoidin domain-containing protein [Bdellovibrionales bacterium]